eukprot:COSAG02_NODE_46153_length_351_cov_0.853175_1_plen_67_part_01
MTLSQLPGQVLARAPAMAGKVQGCNFHTGHPTNLRHIHSGSYRVGRSTPYCRIDTSLRGPRPSSQTD